MSGWCILGFVGGIRMGCVLWGLLWRRWSLRGGEVGGGSVLTKGLIEMKETGLWLSPEMLELLLEGLGQLVRLNGKGDEMLVVGAWLPSHGDALR